MLHEGRNTSVCSRIEHLALGRLEPFGAEVGPTRPSLNLRVAKVVPLPRGRLQVSVDALNALNTNAFWTMTFASGPTFGYGTAFTNPRALQFGAAYTF